MSHEGFEQKGREDREEPILPDLPGLPVHLRAGILLAPLRDLRGFCLPASLMN
jgi:hypothetical protein